jgi:pSer/pThr/pTyr-binding forkhead associated (FHA) protein
MIQLNILSGKKMGEQTVVRRFPFSVGRGAGNDLQLDEGGVWDSHLILEFQKETGFNLSASSGALAAVNGEPVQNAFLHNGDIITAGSVKLQFWLAAARQHGLRARESFVWALIALVTATQFALVYWLIR